MISTVQKIMDRIEIEGDCWIFRGYIDPNGYGRVTHGKVRRLAHRVMFEAFVGPVMDGRVLHHKCETPACVRPSHLTPVTPLEHKREHARSHCGRGHELTPENLYEGRGGRPGCRECARLGFRDHFFNATRAGVPKRNARRERTHCIRGHPFDEENTRYSPDGERVCRACVRIRSARRRQEAS